MSVDRQEIWRFAALRLAKNITSGMLSRGVSAGLFRAQALGSLSAERLRRVGDLQAAREENSRFLGNSLARLTAQTGLSFPCAVRCSGAATAFPRPIRDF